MRETNALIADARAQLAPLGDQIGRMMEQLDTMATVTDRARRRRALDLAGRVGGAAADGGLDGAARRDQSEPRADPSA